MNITQAQLQWLRSPGLCLPKLAEVHDQATGQFIRYNPARLTQSFQQEVLAYLDNPPRTKDGQTRWLTCLTARQMGKSLAVEYGCYPKTAYTPGYDHVCIADTDDRANYLHRRVHFMHDRWPEPLRVATIAGKEVRQLSFDPQVGGRMRVLSAESGAVGIGQSPDTFHASECAFWSDFSGSMMLILPSLINRDHCLAVFECTPWTAGDDWHEHVLLAKSNTGRHKYLFKPFWDGHLNRRPWDKAWTFDNDELRLMNQYGIYGLTAENLGFRRLMLEMDPEIRRRPETFATFYPFDDITCWVTSAFSAIPSHAIERHKSVDLVDTSNLPYAEFLVPNPEHKYIIGVDPCGHAARDHAAFQVLELDDNGWTQVASYAAHTDPIAFTRKLMEVGLRFNKAQIVVENNGVGQACLALLREWAYPRIYYSKAGQPGAATTSQSIDQMTSWLIDALMDELVLHDKNTVEQLLTYKHDKRVEESPTTETVRGAPSKRRRERHHWDKVSALMLAVLGARHTYSMRAGARQRELPAGDNPVHSGLYRADDQRKKWEAMQAARRLASRPDPWYRR